MDDDTSTSDGAASGAQRGVKITAAVASAVAIAIVIIVVAVVFYFPSQTRLALLLRGFAVRPTNGGDLAEGPGLSGDS